MTEEEIAYQNERRRMRYKLKKLNASIERTAGSTSDHPSSDRTAGSTSDGHSGFRRHHWRWKVEARRVKGGIAVDRSSAVKVLSFAAGDAKCDDSETTETDESMRGSLSPSYFASFVMISLKSDDNLAACYNEGSLIYI